MYKFSCVVVLALVVSACGVQSADQAVEKARESMVKGKFGDAVIQLKNALQQEPSRADARVLLGEALMNSGDVASALIEFQKADELKASADQLHPLTAKAMLLLGKVDKVVAQFDGTSVNAPAAKAELFGYLAAANLALGQRDVAKKWIERALEQDAKQIDALLTRVRLLVLEGRAEAAQQALDEFLKIHPNSSRGHQQHADMALARGDRAGAMKSFEIAVTAEPKNFSAHTSLVLLHLQEQRLDAANAQLDKMRKLAAGHPMVRYLGALIALQRNDLKAALEQAQAFLKSDPANLTGLRLVGFIALQQGQLELASSSFAKAVSVAPEDIQSRLGLARAQLAVGDGAAVVKTLLTPGQGKGGAPSWDSTVLLGQAYMMLGDNVRAEEYFRLAAKMNPRDVQSRTALALSAIKGGRAEEGLSDLRAIASADSEGRVADIALVNVLLMRGDFEQAEKAVQAMEKKQPDGVFGSFMRGVVQQRRGDIENARQTFEAVLKKSPRYFPAVSALVNMEMEAGDFSQARQRAESFFGKNSRDVQAGMLLAQVLGNEGSLKNDPKIRRQLVEHLALLSKANPAEATVRVSHVLALIEANDLRGANDAAQAALLEMPGRADLLDVLARVQNRLGDRTQAVQTYAKSIAANPALPDVHVRLAEVHAEHKDLTAALQSVRRALQIKPDYMPALNRLYELEVARGDLAASLKVARQVQTVRPDLPDGWILEADVLARKNDWSPAIAAMRRALSKRDTGDLAAVTHRLMLSAKLGDEARSFESRRLSSYPDDVQFRNYLLNNALVRKDFSAAERLCRDILKIRPNHGSALNNMAWLQVQAKRSESLDFALRAVAVSPNRPEYLDTLAQAYSLTGNLDAAIETQSKAVSIAPGNALHRLNLVKVLIAGGKHAQARTEFETVRKSGGVAMDTPEMVRLEADLAK